MGILTERECDTADAAHLLVADRKSSEIRHFARRGWK